MAREIEPGFYWIYEGGPDRSEMFAAEGSSPAWANPDEAVYIPQCAYLLCGEEESLLLDTLSPAGSDHILDELEALLDGDGLDYLVVSHPDVPHAGNTLAILDAYPDATLVAPRYGDDHELYRLDDALRVGEGDEIDLGGYVVAFHEATFLDAPVSLWMSERTTDTLFPIDWLGFPHGESEALQFVDELDAPLGDDRLVQFHGRVLFWHQYVDVSKVKREIDRLIATHEPEQLAPAHGLVVRREATEQMTRMKGVVEEIERRDRIGTLG
ncbi:flavodoxin/nitric oxide synthase [Halobacteriales archaeon QH_7_66_36]|nr:MAG: flavodoxin/nitric oxide synthase [Halobacteriales archaeon QH_7_66_36]